MHTVAEVGFWDDPKILAFSAKVGNRDAGAWVLRLREFALLRGTVDGKLPGYSAEEIAAKMRPTCSPRMLFEALQRFRILRRRRKTWYLPEWTKSQMGKYCDDREWDRKRKRELREAAHAAALAKVNGEGEPVDVHGTSGDVYLTSTGDLTVIKKGHPADVRKRPPGAPRRGADDGATRWGWFAQNYLKISAPEKCQRLLARLTPEEWEHLQFAVPRQMARYRGERGTKFCPGAVAYLTDKRFLEIRMQERDKGGPPEKAKKPEPKKSEKEIQAELRAHALKSLRELLADPDAPDKQKTKAREQWERTWGDRPWEKSKG